MYKNINIRINHARGNRIYKAVKEYHSADYGGLNKLVYLSFLAFLQKKNEQHKRYSKNLFLNIISKNQ
nr:hypothetical protein [Shigella boydii]